ncbi:MAG: class I mannose-6-phosphate isomerase [Mycoplasma sp.]|nr:class I mannose-6-phosphate isomerase [Mycoplasma sp.]
MKKIESVKLNKIWGWEKWIYSPLKANRTKFENGEFTPLEGPLIKIIKATDNLSLQIHPDDKMALELENEPNGKSECWYVLDSEPGAKLIVGLKTNDLNEIKKAIENDEWNDLIKKQVVKKGDFINIPSGLVHGIGAGVKVLEVQQPSDVTYRFYDYNRLENGKPRELHIEKGLKSLKDVTSVLEPTKTNPLEYNDIYGTITFCNADFTTKTKGVLVDLDTEESFFVEKDEKIKIKNKNFAFIKWGE